MVLHPVLEDKGRLHVAAGLCPLFEKAWSEIVQTPAPRQPLVGRTRRLEIGVFDPGLGQLFAETLRARTFHRTDSQEKDLYFLIECVGVCKYTVVGGLRIKSAPAAAAAAESADVSELVQVGERGRKRLHPSHR